MDVVAGIRETIFAGRVVVEGGAGVFGEKAEEGAKGLRAEGALEGGMLRCTVSDDGCGFDPDDRPGMAEGDRKSTRLNSSHDT